jgi:hypothetical protein
MPGYLKQLPAGRLGRSGVGGHPDLPAGGHEKDSMAITERDWIR